jgi:hypothetical protein
MHLGVINSFFRYYLAVKVVARYLGSDLYMLDFILIYVLVVSLVLLAVTFHICLVFLSSLSISDVLPCFLTQMLLVLVCHRKYIYERPMMLFDSFRCFHPVPRVCLTPCCYLGDYLWSLEQYIIILLLFGKFD